MLRKIIKNTKFAFSGFQKNPYTVLGLSPTASEEEIKSAYFKLAKQYHPDLQPQLVEKFKEVNEAYNILKDPSKRLQYSRSQTSSQQENRNSNPYSNYRQNQYENGQYWQDPQRNDYYQHNESPFQRRYPRSYYGFDPNNPFQSPNIKMRRQFRKSYMDAGYYQHDPFGRDPFSRSLLYLTLILSMVFLAGSLIFTFNTLDKIKRKDQRYQYFPLDELELERDQEQQYY